MSTRKSEKILLIITVSLIVLTFVFTQIIEPQLNNHAKLQRQKDSLELSLAKMKQNVLSKDRIDKKYAELGQYMVKCSSDTKDAFDFARELRVIYESAGIVPIKSDFKPAIKDKYYKKVIIQLEIEGGAMNIMRFIEKVNLQEKPIRIDKAEISAKEVSDKIKAIFWISKLLVN